MTLYFGFLQFQGGVGLGSLHKPTFMVLAAFSRAAYSLLEEYLMKCQANPALTNSLFTLRPPAFTISPIRRLFLSTSFLCSTLTICPKHLSDVNFFATAPKGCCFRISGQSICSSLIRKGLLLYKISIVSPSVTPITFPVR